jgi:hypothetical protein
MNQRKCIIDGCEKMGRTRSMCANHYRIWLRTYTGPKFNKSGLRQQLLDAMPGTASVLVKQVGCNVPWGFLLLQKMVDEGLAHMPKWIPPDGSLGNQWRPEFHEGPGPNRPQPSKKKRRAWINKSRREAHARRKERKDHPELVSPFGALFVIAKGRENHAEI